MSNEIPLGKTTDYPTQYAPELLFPVARQPKRDEIGVPENVDWYGADLWTAYEVSWLNVQGKPEVAIVEFEFAADSPNIVESKSFKLYLNSFNQERFASQDEVIARLNHDLSKACGKPLENLRCYSLDAYQGLGFGQLNGQLIDELEVTCDEYDYNPQLLKLKEPAVEVSETLYTHLLKSNCLITSQPDWATLVIEYTGPKIDAASLLQYVVSFRNHNEFHEQCVERIFQDLSQHCQPRQLLVQARYTRRGGLDINPWRSNFATQRPFMRLARQ